MLRLLAAAALLWILLDTQLDSLISAIEHANERNTQTQTQTQTTSNITPDPFSLFHHHLSSYLASFDLSPIDAVEIADSVQTHIKTMTNNKKTQYTQKNTVDTNNHPTHDPTSAPAPAVPTRPIPVSSSLTSPTSRAAFVRSEFLHAWAAYERFAWGNDELRPVTKQGQHSFGMMLTMIDSVDTLYLMGFTDEYERVRDFVSRSLAFDRQENINTFEVTIRILGGLESIYCLSGDSMWLDKAVDLGERLLIAFDSPSGLPYGTLGFQSKSKYNPEWSGGASSMAEVGSIQLEFQLLSNLTGNPLFAAKVDEVTRRLELLNVPLYSPYINVDSGQQSGQQVFTLGARVDSVYEYFLKQYLLSPSDRPQRQRNRSMYLASIRAIVDTLVKKSEPNGLYFLAEQVDGQLSGKMDHLACFVPGMMALSVMRGVVTGDEAAAHTLIAERLMRTCYEFYSRTPTGLSAEINQFASGSSPDFHVDDRAQHSLLRPETVESLFYLWRLTHDDKYRVWGWDIMTSLVQYARIDSGGYSGLRDVRRSDRPADEAPWANHNDHMESFFLAETMKYLYLLYSDDELIPLDKYVFNTEAHIFPVFQEASTATDKQNEHDQHTHDIKDTDAPHDEPIEL